MSQIKEGGSSKQAQISQVPMSQITKEMWGFRKFGPMSLIPRTLALSTHNAEKAGNGQNFKMNF